MYSNRRTAIAYTAICFLTRPHLEPGEALRINPLGRRFRGKDSLLSLSHSEIPESEEAYVSYLLHSMIYIEQRSASYSAVTIRQKRNGNGLGQPQPISKSPRPRSGIFRRWLCCTWRSRALSRPSTRAHASARCALLSCSRSPRGPKTASAVRSA